MKLKNLFLMSACFFSSVAIAQSFSEAKTAQYFESIKSNPQKLSTFLLNLPKGGDLHNHESGATYAENMLSYAHTNQFCVNRETFAVFNNSSCRQEDLLNNAVKDVSFKDALIDAWSMRHFKSIKNNESGHDHFFASFSKFGLIANEHRGEVLSEIAERAGNENEQYLELMVTADGNESGKLGKKLGWNPDLNVMRQKLLKANFEQIITDISNSLTKDEVKMRSLQACETQHPKPGCQVKIRYLYQVLRGQAPEMVFAQLLAGFEAASKEPRVVGLNMVQPEDGKISMRDYALHMKMVAYLHALYPNVHISLHAGELTGALVPKDGLKFHIHDAVNVAQADRIGHGVDIAQEDHADELLQQMANRHTMVEINLTSNAYILNVEGQNHPLPLYMKYGVPVAISTDDEGVSRSNLTKEFQRAVNTYNFSYYILKTFIRNSMAYSFLPGESVWKDDAYQKLVSVCQNDIPGSGQPSQSCQAFLSANEKAEAQWELEKRFVAFEDKIAAI